MTPFDSFHRDVMPSPTATPNLSPIYTKDPVQIKVVKNGKLFTVGEGEDQFLIAHVWGTPYDMGFAHGQLVSDKAVRMMDAVWKYLEDQIVQAVNGTVDIFKPWFLRDVANIGLDAALDLELDVTREFTGKYFFEEAQGLADGSGVDLKRILRIHMIGEFTKGSCSMLGAWGTANSLIQLRTLDWSVDGPFKDFPQVTVYHPINDGKNGQDFANFGWTGWIGSITGMNSQRMAISEIGVSFPDETFGKESRFGVPFTFILRDILQFDKTLDDAINRLSNAKRTCDLILGVGDGKSRQFRSVEYSGEVAYFFDDKNLRPDAYWHPKIDNVVYHGMDWNCPAYNDVMARQLTKYHGNITAESIIRDVVPIVQTGDLLVSVYDLTNNFAYIANARASFEGGAPFAYQR
ncbi:hypothetical protein FSP39_004201 [Pinctada imbricata]|uniref:Uncharacterized protein n=1 Tax=Pinctada imbricata TaxID=66713 RepID=A0AA89BLI0_PINIB|nr:hypothetical protein FSP39_004201 [Pinctada imbricata]